MLLHASAFVVPSLVRAVGREDIDERVGYRLMVLVADRHRNIVVRGTGCARSLRLHRDTGRAGIRVSERPGHEHRHLTAAYQRAGIEVRSITFTGSNAELVQLVDRVVRRERHRTEIVERRVGRDLFTVGVKDVTILIEVGDLGSSKEAIENDRHVLATHHAGRVERSVATRHDLQRNRLVDAVLDRVGEAVDVTEPLILGIVYLDSGRACRPDHEQSHLETGDRRTWREHTRLSSRCDPVMGQTIRRVLGKIAVHVGELGAFGCGSNTSRIHGLSARLLIRLSGDRHRRNGKK